MIFPLDDLAHAIPVAPFHTSAVKCPVTPRLPDLHPGMVPQLFTSLYHISTALAGDSPFDAMARFSPAGPPCAGVSLYDLECDRLLAFLNVLYVSAASTSFHTRGGAPCLHRAMFVS